METVLVVFTLAIKSSYAQNVELDASAEEFDTVQFYYAGADCWRIKTFAVDQDVHVWNIEKSKTWSQWRVPTRRSTTETCSQRDIFSRAVQGWMGFVSSSPIAV
jgi:hypothetical protein